LTVAVFATVVTAIAVSVNDKATHANEVASKIALVGAFSARIMMLLPCAAAIAIGRYISFRAEEIVDDVYIADGQEG
jgi:hypothetical protein